MSANLLLFIPIGFLLAVILGFIVRAVELLTLRKGTVIAEYKAPNLLSPAELGYLVDKDFGDNELLATALTLVGKEFVDLNKNEAGNPLLVARDDIKDIRLKELNDGELAVWSWIRGQRLGTVAWNDISNLFSSTLGARASYEQEVRNMLISKDYLSSSSPFSLKGIAPFMFIAFGVILLLLIPAAYYVAGQTSSAEVAGKSSILEVDPFALIDRDVSIMTMLLAGALLWLPMVYCFRLMYLTFYYAADQPIGITNKFRHDWHDVAGFQLFIKTVEFSRLDADANPYDASMPYAVALGFKPNFDKMTDLALRK